MLRFELVVASDIIDFEEQVNAMLRKGWNLYYGPVLTTYKNRSALCQALTLTYEPPKPRKRSKGANSKNA
jgi:hypothetical protein